MQLNWILVKFWKGKAKTYQCSLGDYWKITRLSVDYSFWFKQLIWPVLGVQACSGEWVKQKVDKNKTKQNKKKNRKRKRDRRTKKEQNRKDEKERRKRRAGRANFLLLRLLFCAVLVFTTCRPFPLTRPEADQDIEVSRDACSSRL